jgi:hypothetical protein
MKTSALCFAVFICLQTLTACNEESKSRADVMNEIQENAVPAPVKTAFTAKYPGASDIIWENATEGNLKTIKIKFKRDGKYWKAEFTTDGTFVKENEDDN